MIKTNKHHDLIKGFADQHRLTVIKDECDDPIIRGKHGHLYEYDDDTLAVCFVTPATERPRTYFWRKHSASCVSAGMVLRQNGDAEGCLSFDPGNRQHVKFALKLAGIKRKRHMTAKALERLAAARAVALDRRKRLVQSLVSA